jgi:hypothetical protein
MASTAARPADPVATASATLVMMGLGVMFTPNLSGRVMVMLSGVAFTWTSVVPFAAGGRFGTGKPPANGDAVSGTRFGAATDPVITAAATSGGVGFMLADIVGLIPGTTYWFDLALSTTNAGAAATAKSISVQLAELP